jgi:hypothetical protein
MGQDPDTRLRACVRETLEPLICFSRKVTNMRSFLASSKSLAILVILFGILACVPLLSNANVSTTAITIVNNSSRAIRHVYLSAPDQSNWGPDQLGSSVIAAGGGSVTISATCNGANIRVIAEDQNGCFLYQVVACSGSVTWTITNDTVPDCGD